MGICKYQANLLLLAHFLRDSASVFINQKRGSIVLPMRHHKKCKAAYYGWVVQLQQDSNNDRGIDIDLE